MDKRFGHYSFAIGVLIAILLGLAGTMHFEDTTKFSLMSILVLLGIAVGLLNITGGETREFLLSSGVFVIVALLSLNMRVFDGIPYIGLVASDLLRSIVSFTMPTVLVVAVKNIWRLAKTK
jgi:hypothetical protein